jgi:uncharacterized protein YndB with AHSA1/START domain
MTEGEYQPVTVSRRINSSAHDIFQILANPARHQEFDGSDSLRGARSAEVVTGVGDVFVMKMHFPHLGDYEMNNHVVEYERDRRIGWEPEAGARASQRGPGQSRSGPLGAAVELPAHPGRPGRDRRDRNVRLLTRSRGRASWHGQRQGLGLGYGRDIGSA